MTIEPEAPLPRFRDYLFRSLLLQSVVLALAAALLVFATNKLTEDATFERVMRATTAGAESGWHRGPLPAMPVPLQPQLQRLPTGYHELSDAGSETAVVKSLRDGVAQYSLLVVSDTDATPFISVFGLIGGLAWLLAIVQSWRLARRFSQPLEALAGRLEAGTAATPAGAQVSELHELSVRLGRLQRYNAERLAQEVSFAQSVSHELRTPITVIQGALELMARTDALSDPARTRLGRIERSLKSMRLTVETLLYLARAEQRVLQTGDAFPAALARIVDEQRLAAPADLVFELNVRGHPPGEHEWAPLLIALQTLTANAARYSRQGTVRVTVDRDGASVRDAGAGMSAEQLRRAVANQPAGGELGFAIVHRICQRCNWALGVENSRPGILVYLDFRAPYVEPQPLEHG